MQSFPYYEVKGEYGDIGRFIGNTFRTRIQEAIDRRKHAIAGYNRLRELSKPYFTLTDEHFPHLTEELTETARGAGGHDGL